MAEMEDKPEGLPSGQGEDSKDKVEHHLEALEPSRAGIVRTVIGGALMGIANIIPGVSGGTMILAVGLYEEFVESVANLTRLKIRLPSLVFIGILGVSAVAAILLAVTPINWGLENHHHVMFSLFIGLTLGGVPLIWREISPVKPRAIAGIAGGFLLMAIIAFALQEMALPENWVVFVIAGMIAAAAMVLPGISGSYLLLIFGLYYPISKAVEEFRDALKAMEIDSVLSIGFGIILPVGLGVLAGIALLTNLLKGLLHRHFDATMGTLLGLLVGSVMGLYPFKPLMDVEKEGGEAVRVVVAEAHAITPANVVLVLLSMGIGFGATYLITRLGGTEPLDQPVDQPVDRPETAD